ncbi:MAG TPA: prepilin-type N-terminal cleavage/methylation domain-containing protein [Rhodanobacteraceae bacterium]|nr:prepilin-type N-terminal cleavage/methylation domain-containing protein [Rhodanobacteraceae bacterium]
MTKPRSSAGFTLLEVMLAIVLLALLLAGTWGAIRTAVHAMHSGEAAIDRTNRLRVAEEFMRRQISRILPLAYGTDDSTGSNFVFEGKGDFMRFVAPMPGYLSKGGPYVQTLRLEHSRGGGMALVFTDAMLNGFDLEDQKASAMEPAVLLDQIQDGRFEYRTLDDQGELTDWSSEWDDPSVTPVMVRIAITMRPEARVEFPDMEIPLMLDVGASHAMGRPGGVLNRGMGGLRRRPIGGGP